MAKLSRRKTEFRNRQNFFRKNVKALEVMEVMNIFQKFVDDITAKKYMFTLSYVNANVLDEELYGHMGVVSNISPKNEGALEAYSQLIASSLVRMSVEFKVSPEELFGMIGTRMVDFEERIGN